MNQILRLSLTILYTCVGLCAAAQSYVVQSFEISPDDIDARVNSRVGNNGRKCALIKVYVQDGINHANGSVIGEIEAKGMEKRIYMAHDSKQVELVFDNHLPLRIKFDDYKVPVVTEQTVYILRLVDPQSNYSNLNNNSLNLANESASSQSQPSRKLIFSSGKKVYSCDGIYRGSGHHSGGFYTDLGELNRKHFAISIDFYPDVDIHEGTINEAGVKFSNDCVLSLGVGWRLLSIFLSRDGLIEININQRKHYKTPLKYQHEEWNSISLEYNGDVLTINGYIIKDVNINPYDGDNILSDTYYASGSTFKGRLTNVKVYSYNEE